MDHEEMFRFYLAANGWLVPWVVGIAAAASVTHGTWRALIWPWWTSRRREA